MNRIGALNLLFFILLLCLNVVAVWITVIYGSFLGFTFNHLVVASLTIGTVLFSILALIIDEKRFKISDKGKLLGLISFTVSSRLPFLVNENPVIPEELGVLIRVMPLQPVLRLPWFFQNYRAVLDDMYVHPPVSFILGNLGYLVTPDIVGLRLFSFILSILSVWPVYMIAKEFSRSVSYATALFYSLNPLIVMFTVMGYTDGYCLFFGLFGLFLFTKALKKKWVLNTILSGVFIGLSLLSKSTIGFIWIILILLIALSNQSSGRSYSIQAGLRKASLSISAALATITPWAYINPESFRGAYISFPAHILSRFFDLDIVTGVVNPINEVDYVTPSSSTLENIAKPVEGLIDKLVINPLQNFFPMYTSTPMWTISYIELYLKLLIFLTPLVIPTAMIALPVSLKKRSRGFSYRRIALLIIWILIPQLAFLGLIRNERWFLPSVLPVLILSAYWMKTRQNSLKRAYAVSLIGFMMVFLAISWTIANQSYAGGPKIRSLIEENDIPHQKILTNYWLARELFLESDVHVVKVSNISELQTMILNGDYDCIIVRHHNRGAGVQLSENDIGLIESLYDNKVKAGSNFSYIEIFYE